MLKHWLSFFTLLIIMGGAVIFNNYFDARIQPEAIQSDSLEINFEVKEPTFLYGIVVDDHVVIEDKIKRNESLSDILEHYNVPSNLIHQLSRLSRKVFDARKIVTNKKYTLDRKS